MRSLQVHVPAGCPNKCPFCCSAAHHNQKNAKMTVNRIHFLPRMNYARDHDCDFLMLTSTGEPLMNPDYIETILSFNRELRRPFDAIDLQTSGAELDNAMLGRIRDSGITTIALSVAYLLDSKKNAKIMRMPERYQYNIGGLCSEIKELGFTLRLCLNLTPDYKPISAVTNHVVGEIFETAKVYGADQITFKRLYANKDPKTEDEKAIHKWVLDGTSTTEHLAKRINTRIKFEGRKIATLPGGEEVYSINGMSTVLMSDCQAQRLTDTPRYFILRPNGKLYTRWDDDGSIIF